MKKFVLISLIMILSTISCFAFPMYFGVFPIDLDWDMTVDECKTKYPDIEYCPESTIKYDIYQLTIDKDMILYLFFFEKKLYRVSYVNIPLSSKEATYWYLQFLKIYTDKLGSDYLANSDETPIITWKINKDCILQLAKHTNPDKEAYMNSSVQINYMNPKVQGYIKYMQVMELDAFL